MTRLMMSMLACALVGACDRSATRAPPAASAVPVPLVSASPAASAPGSPPASSASVGREASETRVSFDAESVGAPSASFEGVVGDWSVGEASGARGLLVDGSRWRNGTPSAGLAEQAKRLYGDRYAEFLDGVKAFAFYPFAIWRGEPPRDAFSVSVRFYPFGGKIDQAAGIAFAIAPDGSYQGVRANALEDNVLYFRVVKGKRAVLDVIRDVSTPSKSWHTLRVSLDAKHLAADLDGRKVLEKTLDAPPEGRIGLWSKADSQVLFDDFQVLPDR